MYTDKLDFIKTTNLSDHTPNLFPNTIISVMIKIKSHTPYGGYVSKIFCQGTGNCQMAVAWYGEVFLKAFNIEEAQELFKHIINNCIKQKIYMFDVVNSRVTKQDIEAVFGDNSIVGHLPYTSTNGSTMSIYLVDTKNLRNW